jgi:hypothetical protein
MAFYCKAMTSFFIKQSFVSWFPGATGLEGPWVDFIDLRFGGNLQKMLSTNWQP